MADKTLRVATDVGGTFTDLVCFETDPQPASRASRRPSPTPRRRISSRACSTCSKGRRRARTIKFLAHGTTVVINALTERKGVKVGLITTEGFRDSLEIARGNRPDFFNLHYEKPKPFVPRYLRRELPGRITYKGEELKPLDLSGLPAIVEDFKADGVQAVAICFLHSYADPAHEKAALAELKKLWPDVSAVSSHQITREWREYERTNTAVLSAYVQPIAERYLARLKDGLAERGFAGSPYIMQSNCGVDSLEAVSKIPITMVESGPASGFWGAAELGKLIGEPNILALDIGGTTAKCSLIEDGQVRIMTDYWIERDRTFAGYPIMVPGRRSGGDRQWRRLDRLGRRFRQAACRPAIGRRHAGPGRLWPWRHGSHHHRRQSLARPHQPRLFLRRRGGRRHGAGEVRHRGRRRESSASMPTRPRAASSASPTTTWSMR
jgi:N-methylhydantoinase A